jgi:hypothetical protein
MTGKGIVCMAAFYFLAVAFGWKIAIGAVSLLIVANLAISV